MLQTDALIGALMKVETTTQNQILAVNTAPKNTTEPVMPAVADQKSDAFNVQISDKVKEMMAALPSEDDVRLDKVAAIREQLAKGNYNISGKDVADKILNALKS